MDDFEDIVERVIAQIDPACQYLARNDIAALRSRGAGSWPDLLAVLDDQVAGEDRAKACWLLGRTGDERAFRPLIAALHDPDPRLRGEAARALGALGSPRAVPGLIAVLQADTDSGTRMAAAYSLGLLGDHRAVDPLLARLADSGEDRGRARVRCGGAYRAGGGPGPDCRPRRFVGRGQVLGGVCPRRTRRPRRAQRTPAARAERRGDIAGMVVSQ